MSRPQVPSEYVGPALLGVTSALTAFNSFLPHISEVRAHTPNDADFAGDVRLGELAAGAFVLGFGAIATSLTGSMAPTYISVIMTIALVGLYELALRSINLFGGQ